MKKIIIAAMDLNGVIGKSNGDMPWHSKEEFQHFKNSTSGHPIIMGRKTFESLGNPLPGRLNIVLTTNKELKNRFEEIIIFDKLNDAYEYCEKNNFAKIFLIGGGSLFPTFMNDADEMIISVMNFYATGDIYFPEIDKNIWMVQSTVERSVFEIFYYVRKQKNE